jgi:rhodanese-related sulfurtransferase
LSLAENARYAGDVSPQDAFERLKSNPKARLVDVRTSAEWVFVGSADLSHCGKDVVLVEWVSFPTMERNSSFTDQVIAEIGEASKTDPVFFLCRSGARSLAAAEAMTALGFSQCFNVAEGFEGDLNEDRHRGGLGGWKARGLPWAQK